MREVCKFAVWQGKNVFINLNSSIEFLRVLPDNFLCGRTLLFQLFYFKSYLRREDLDGDCIRFACRLPHTRCTREVSGECCTYRIESEVKE